MSHPNIRLIANGQVKEALQMIKTADISNFAPFTVLAEITPILREELAKRSSTILLGQELSDEDEPSGQNFADAVELLAEVE